ncbi:ArsC family reductase [Acetobacter sicerae]|uniref:ArsC family reductase n=1 Tax=Acetobacter sicerae TaxID=85325 RepID=A0ABS8VRZ9_9PROT|nr:ArsC family reductase [Acetobacter sicerae]MCE0743672.1 ArsC family reductase [Acetobacter sicerae]
MTVAIYGIRSCDTMKKTMAWLDAHDIAYTFHDYKKEGVDRTRLLDWIKEAGWAELINRSGTTFRKLPDADKTDLTEEKAVQLMLSNPSMIRRPVLEASKLLIGFKPEKYAEFFKS